MKKQSTAKQPTDNKPAGVSDKAVVEATGLSWAKWLQILDKAGARNWEHKKIAAWIDDNYTDIDGWWAQTVAVGYEQVRGLRERHQQSDGYSVSASKTMNVAVDRLYAAWSEPRLRGKWLPGEKFEITTATPNKSLRILWSDGKTRVEVYFYDKSQNKSQLAVQHRKLPDQKMTAQMRQYWKERLAALGELLQQ